MRKEHQLVLLKQRSPKELEMKAKKTLKITRKVECASESLRMELQSRDVNAIHHVPLVDTTTTQLEKLIALNALTQLSMSLQSSEMAVENVFIKLQPQELMLVKALIASELRVRRLLTANATNHASHADT
jgi:hypothetical protein